MNIAHILTSDQFLDRGLEALDFTHGKCNNTWMEESCCFCCCCCWMYANRLL